MAEKTSTMTMHTIRFLAPIADMNGFAPLGGKQGGRAEMRALFDSLLPAPPDAVDIAGVDLLDATGEEVASRDVLLAEAEKVLGEPLAVILGRGRQALAELNDRESDFVDVFGFPLAGKLPRRACA